MKTRGVLLAGLICAVFTAAASANEFVVTFDGDAESWSNSPNEGYLKTEGGNPGAYFSMVSSFGGFRSNPMPRTFLGEAEEWLGDYRIAEVTSIGIDIIVLGAKVNFESPGSLFLYSNMGTKNMNDDQVIYYLTDWLPAPGNGWISYDVPLDPSGNTPPPGWQFGDPTPHDPAPAYDFEILVQNVSTVGFLFCRFGDQANLGFTNVGIDNPRLTFGSPPLAHEKGLEDLKKAYMGGSGDSWFDIWHESER